MSSLIFIFSLSFLTSFSIVQATVPPSKTFKLVNSGIFYGYADDYQVYYTDVEEKYNHKVEKLSNFPFNLCFSALSLGFNNTSNDFTLSLRLDDRLVWIARQTKTVGRNATLTFGPDGNLVLTGVDGHIVWETETANKGVVDIKLLHNGNMVLLDKKGVFVWQSFHYPIDCLVVGQSIRSDGVYKLVSRMSAVDPTPGPYSLVMEGKKMAFYYKSKHNKPEIYSRMESLFMEIGTLTEMWLGCEINNDPSICALELSFTENNSTWSVFPKQPHYNATYSFLQLGGDGNLRFYTYLYEYSEWQQTYIHFSRKPLAESECKLPERCGAFGVCEDNQCVACPSPEGLMGWSKSCAPPKLLPCKLKGMSAKVDYYMIVGVDHFSSNYASETMKQDDCRQKCTVDCKCRGFFYKTKESKCLITSQLNTLTKVSNSTHLAFIKTSASE